MTNLSLPVAPNRLDSRKPWRADLNDRELRTATYREGGVVYRRAEPRDDADLRKILRDCVMSSWVTLSFEREPCYFTAEKLLDDSVTVIAREDDELSSLVGMYSCTHFTVHVNGRHERVGYLGGLRVSHTQRNKLRIIKNGFSSIRHLVPNESTVPFWFTSVASENTAARRLLEARLPGMPVYRPAGDLETLVISTRHARSHRLLQPAERQDVPALVDFFNRQAGQFQFAPVLDEETLISLNGHAGLSLTDFWLLKDGQDILGCLAVWDQRRIKQSVIRGYSFPLNALRPAYNLFAMLTKGLLLPAPGNRLEHAYLAFVALDSEATDFSGDAVREALLKAGDKGARAGILGLSPQNSLCDVLKRNFRPHVYRSVIETVAWTEDAHPLLDDRPPQPEVALL